MMRMVAGWMMRMVNWLIGWQGGASVREAGSNSWIETGRLDGGLEVGPQRAHRHGGHPGLIG